DLEQAFGPGDPPPHWRSAAERPSRWLVGYASALADVWNTTEPLWQRGRPLLDREVERIGVATVRGGPELLLGALSDRIAYGERGLRISDVEAGTYDLGDRKIVLVPMLAGKDALIFSLDNPDAVWIAYPVPGADSLWRKPVAPAMDELSALVGPVRADLLCALDQPMTMSMLATDMKIAPSGLTYHCDRLRAGRLITRERRGREVWIARTHRAEELMELFRR
ncbi:winged helix-turn-helix domain-containing protein, partial [Nonomuraea sp. NPDC049784]|uniref:ArsR/SmtB family transcription factor n=1 Tax=Nonomuraea sp. NPDC049784 TaxID=3154361 RepID=UPI0033E15FAE